jgi:hypothetical protein
LRLPAVAAWAEWCYSTAATPDFFFKVMPWPLKQGCSRVTPWGRSFLPWSCNLHFVLLASLSWTLVSPTWTMCV